jgi:serine/threonine protein phosphatase PrpC
MTHYTIASASLIGGRAENQDCFRVEETVYGFLALVCDGMGGAYRGKIAAELAVGEIFRLVSGSSEITSREVILSVISKANETIFRQGRIKPWLFGMGTTITALLINENHAVCSHVGDSRIYQFRDGKIIFRTFDHSLVFDYVRSGILTEEEARVSPESNIITRVLGTRPEVEITVSDDLTYKRGDRFLLCTDGIWGALPEIRLTEMASSEKSPEEVVNHLIAYIDGLGVAGGGMHDNMTAVLIEMQVDSL